MYLLLQAVKLLCSVGGVSKRGGVVKVDKGQNYLEKARRRLLFLTAALVVALGVGSGAAISASASDAGSGDTVQPEVIGGTPVPDGKYPFVVALLNRNYGSTTKQQQFCGGSLIDRDSVLTAAHCVTGTSARPLRVTVGRTILNSSQGQVRRVAKIFVNPRYNGRANSTYDSAVLKLSRPVVRITPVRLATARQNFLETPGRPAFVAGWGNTIQQPVYGNNGTHYPNQMREARLPIVSDRVGERAYGTDFFPKLMVAAGRTGKDTCQGDSGGPLFAPVAGRYTQIGLTSFGAGCGARGYPGVYTEINAAGVRSFIVTAARR